MTLIYLISSAVIAYAGFCRLVKTDLNTLLPARVAIWLLTVSAMVGGSATLWWGYVPEWPSALMASSIAVLQVVSSRLWLNGVPDAYVVSRFMHWKSPPLHSDGMAASRRTQIADQHDRMN